MITTISIPSADGTEIAIYARKGKRRVGSYKLKIGLRINDREEIVGSYIRSYAQNLKIPKTLIDEAQRQLKNLAAKRKTTPLTSATFSAVVVLFAKNSSSITSFSGLCFAITLLRSLAISCSLSAVLVFAGVVITPYVTATGFPRTTSITAYPSRPYPGSMPRMRILRLC